MPDNPIPVALTLDSKPSGRGKLQVRCLQGSQVIFSDELAPSKAAERTRFIKGLREKYPILDADKIDDELLKLTESESKSNTEEDPEPNSPSPQKLLDATPSNVVQAAIKMLENPNLIESIIEDQTAIGIAGETELKVALILTGVSRQLRKPMALIVQGPSASGKSFVIENTAKLFPPEAILQAHQMTSQSLYHLPQGSLKHKWIVAGERSRLENDERAEATKALREMISSGNLTKLMPGKPNVKKVVTEKIEQEGPIAFVESTTMSMVFDEDQNRCLMVHTNETPDQTRLIMQSMVDAHGRHSSPINTDSLIAKHHALQRILAAEAQGRSIVIPYIASLARALTNETIVMRRVLPLLIAAIQSSALLHYRQRQRDPLGRILADLNDYRIVYKHLYSPFREAMGIVLSASEIRFLNGLLAYSAQHPNKRGIFDVPELVANGFGSKSTLSGWLSKLRDAGFVKCIEPHKGQRAALWLLTNKPLTSQTSVLPDPESLSLDPAHDPQIQDLSITDLQLAVERAVSACSIVERPESSTDQECSDSAKGHITPFPVGA